MSTEILNLEQKKLAISRGLSPFIVAGGLERVLQYWEEVYGHQPTFVLNRFVNDICVTDDLRSMRKEILRQLLSELSELERQVMLRPQTAKAQTQQHKDIELQSGFESFMQRVLAQVKVSDRAEFCTEVMLLVEAELGISKRTDLELNNPMYLSGIAQKHYALVLTHVYRKYCEFYGPSHADAVYARTKEWIQAEFPSLQMNQLL